jgi:hypothetical protein
MRPETDPTSTSPKTTRCRIAENRIRPIRTRYGPGVVSERTGSSPWSARRRPRTDSYKIVSGTAGPDMGPVSCPKEPDQAHGQCGQQRIRFQRARRRPRTDAYKSYPARQDQVRARCRVRKNRIKPMTNAASNGSVLQEPEDDPGPNRIASYPACHGKVRARCRVRRNRIKPMINATRNGSVLEEAEDDPGPDVDQKPVLA